MFHWNPCDRISLPLVPLSSAFGRESGFGILRPHPLGIALVGLLDTLDVTSGP